MAWTYDFEGYPAGKMYGSVTGQVLRQLKQEFEDYMSLEHTFVTTSSPQMTHVVGQCTVCGLSDGTPTDLHNVAGSIWVDYTNNVLYRDGGSGTGVVAVGGTDHGTLTSASRTATDAHSFGVLIAGDTMFGLHTPNIENLSQTSGSYTDDCVLPRGLHLTTPADHEAGVITSGTGLYIGQDKLTSTVSTLYDGTITYGTSQSVSFGQYSFMPYLSAPTTTGAHISFKIPTDATPPDNWEPTVELYNVTGGGDYYIKCQVRTLA